MSNDNIYAPPKSNLEIKNPSSLEHLVVSLYKMSTWLLLFLSIITLGVYYAHYVKRQTLILNDCLENDQKMNVLLPNTFLIISYLSIFLLIFYMFSIFFLELYNSSISESTNLGILDSIENFIDFLYTVFSLVWAFKARAKFHLLLGSEAKHPSWLHGFWTFLFQGYYFNYKINKLNQNNITNRSS